ncbi:hypothetical protein EV356DRAFT_239137 [Viridothelium virens]|uniref:Uncharacterized protein n=1 Tax=Viridothelium virens TaxID=1048519 RepID=A0A6A6H436_VIRVR|nr:hypothetical protein EV356DRAFT_239137 [Viridothelium virens]
MVHQIAKSSPAASLSLFKQQYLQLVEPKKLAWPERDQLRLPEIQAWIYDHMFNTESLPYSPPERYELRVLKQLMSRVEEATIDPNEDEISDDLMSRLSTLLSSKLPSEALSAQHKSYVTYSSILENGDRRPPHENITLLEARSVLSSSGTTGLRTWEAALHLGSFLTTEEGGAFVKNRNVLELGAGTGFLSVLCAKHLGAARVVATDGDHGVVQSLAENLSLNGLRSSNAVRTEVLQWSRLPRTSWLKEEINEYPCDVVLGADLIYDKEFVPSLIDTIRDLIDIFPTLDVVIAATVRNEETVDMFTTRCEESGLWLNDISFSAAPETENRSFFYSTDMPLRIIHIRDESSE